MLSVMQMNVMMKMNTMEGFVEVVEIAIHIGCDICERWCNRKCVEITPAKDESIKLYKSNIG